MPREPPSGEVRANTTRVSAMEPWVMKILEPLITYSSPTFLAVVFMATASEPESGSDSA